MAVSRYDKGTPERAGAYPGTAGRDGRNIRFASCTNRVTFSDGGHSDVFKTYVDIGCP